MNGDLSIGSINGGGVSYTAITNGGAFTISGLGSETLSTITRFGFTKEEL